MFKEGIDVTAFTDLISDKYYRGKIDMFPGTYNYLPDRSFLATLRALLTNKVDSESLQVCSLEIFAPLNCIEVAGMIESPAKYKNCFNVVSLKSNRMPSSDDRNMFNDAVNGVMSSFPEYSELKNVEMLFASKMFARCFVNEEIRSVILFARYVSYKEYHFLQCALPGMFPWYFNVENKLNDLEKQLMQSLTKDSSRAYINALEEIAKALDIRGSIVNELLDSFEEGIKSRKASNIRSNISSIESQIESIMGEYSRLLKRKEELDAEYYYYSCKADESGNDIRNYFLSNKRIRLMDVQNGNIEFIVNGFMEYYDGDSAAKYINNAKSFVYSTDRNKTINPKYTKRLMKEIFINESIRIKTCAAFRIYVEDYTLNAIAGYRYDGCSYDYMPNPHLDRYSCVGDYGRVVRDYLRTGDYVMAVETCVASAESLNWNDAPVMEEFFVKFYNSFDSEKKWLVLRDGSEVTTKEAIKYIQTLFDKEEKESE